MIGLIIPLLEPEVKNNHPQVVNPPISDKKATAADCGNPVKNCSLSQVAPINQLWCLLYQREQLMKEVAANKYLKNKPIYDGVRELEVLSHTTTTAQKKQLPPREMQLYSQIVMDVSRQIQQYWFDSWEEQRTITAKLSLNQIREQIDQIDSAIIDIFVLIRKNSSITFKQLHSGLRESLADLRGIRPSQHPELLINLLANAIYAVVSPTQSA